MDYYPKSIPLSSKARNCSVILFFQDVVQFVYQRRDDEYGGSSLWIKSRCAVGLPSQAERQPRVFVNTAKCFVLSLRSLP